MVRNIYIPFLNIIQRSARRWCSEKYGTIRRNDELSQVRYYTELNCYISMETPDWNETKRILAEIEQLFGRDDDVRDIEDIMKMTSEIEVQRNHHIKEFKELIKRMQRMLTCLLPTHKLLI